VSSSPGEQKVAIRVDPSITGSPAFDTAQRACNSILPQPSNADLAAQKRQQEQHELDMISFARCLRSHGFPTFPDPGSQGNLTPQTVTAAGVDMQSPAFGTAGRACIPASNGAVSDADIEQAQSGDYAPHSSSSAAP
jgi:hypothetical protein